MSRAGHLPEPDAPGGGHWAGLIAPAAIVLCAAAMRLYALEAPELLHDESLVACAADRDLGYIFRRALHSDAHPPYFYWLARLYMQAGTSEAALRMVSALAGAGAVAALFRLGRRVGGEATGLFASALLAGHLLHIELSRVLRPHSLIILLATLCAGLFLDLLQKRDRASLARLLLADLALAFLHFNTLLVLGAQMAVTAVLMAAGRLPARTGLAFLAGCALILPVNLWFALLRLGEFSGVDTKATIAWTALRSLANLDSLLALAPLPMASLAGWLLLAAGFLLLFRDNRETALALAGFLLLPVLALILARYGIIYEPWHLAFLLPMLLLACGRALAALPVPAQLAAPALALGLAAAVLATKHADVYGPQANMFNHGLGQRAVARLLPPLLGERALAAFSHRSLTDHVNWYLRRFSTLDSSRFSLEGTGDAAILLVSPRPPLAPEAHGARLASALGEPEAFAEAGPWAVSRWRIARSPVLAVDTLPAVLALPADSEHMLRHAESVRDVAPVLSPLRDALAPSRYNHPGSVSYRIENRSGSPAQGFTLRAGLANSNPENRLSVSASFDGGRPVELFTHSQVLPSGRVVVRAVEPGGFSRLDLTVSMTCPDNRPGFDNIPDSLVYNGMELALLGRDEAFFHGVAAVESGLFAPEADGQQRIRWGVGPSSLVFFVPERETGYALRLAGNSPLPGQAVEVLLDGQPLGSLDLPEPGRRGEVELAFTAGPGNRLLEFRYARFNHGPGGAFAPRDTRHLAVAFDTFSLRPVQPARSKLVFVTE